jgi:hypothetical protein
MTSAAIGRRRALALLGAGTVAVRCGGARTRPTPEAPATPALKLDPLVDLVPAAGLSWLVQARPQELASSPTIAPAIATMVPAERFDVFALRHGGVDLRRVDELDVAGFPEATLVLARVPVLESRLEAAFAARAVQIEGRAIEGEVTRFWGTVGADREQVAVLGREGLAWERGPLGLLRASVLFAQGKLRRALPVLRAEPLAQAAALLDGDGPAPLRAFAPGPFLGDRAAGLGGLLRAATAIALAARPRDLRDGGAPGSLWVTVLVTGAWGDQAAAAAERLGAAFRVLAEDSLGRLLGLDHPLDGPRVSGAKEALRLDATFDALTLGRGLHAATDATIAEILAY